MSTHTDYPIRMVARVQGNSAVIKALLKHPMENGFGKQPNGELIAAHFITAITLFVNDEIVASLQTGSGIAADPLFGWRIRGVRPGDRIRLIWRDNQDRQQAQETIAQ